MVQCKNYQFYFIFLPLIRTYVNTIVHIVRHLVLRLPLCSNTKAPRKFPDVHAICFFYKSHSGTVCFAILAYRTKRKRFRGNEKKNQTFLKKRPKKNFQPLPWQIRKLEQKQNTLNLRKTCGFENFKLVVRGLS